MPVDRLVTEFRLLPTLERRVLLGFWLAKAQLRFRGVRILALCQLSNHLHLVVEDLHGEISGFMQLALGHFAKRINKLDRLH
jgi:REP element-mobilizing transposase RayT